MVNMMGLLLIYNILTYIIYRWDNNNNKIYMVNGYNG